MNINKFTFNQQGYPEELRQIDSPPKQLYYRADQRINLKNILNKPRVAIVGSRSVSPYGRR